MAGEKKDITKRFLRKARAWLAARAKAGLAGVGSLGTEKQIKELEKSEKKGK